MKHDFIEVLGQTLHFVESIPEHKTHTQRTIVFLHGFPEYWQTWQHQLEYFCAQYRVIAPDLLGYNQSAKPADLKQYQVPALINLLSHFIRKISPNEKIVLVAHDWGGAIAWPLAAFHGELIDKLIILNAAHPSTFTRELIHNPLQRQKSNYIKQLIAADGERVVARDNFAFLTSMLVNASGKPVLDDELQALYHQAWNAPGALTGMLNYYRAMPQQASDDASELAALKIPQIRIQIPTLVLWGEQDKAFVIELLDGIEDYVPLVTVQRFKSASHWLHHEYPQEVNEAIEGFMTSEQT